MAKIKMGKPKTPSLKPKSAKPKGLKVVAMGGKVTDPGYFKKNPLSKSKKV